MIFQKHFCSYRFIRRYRVSKEAFIYILDKIELKEQSRETGITPMQKLAAALQILGSGSYQWTCANDFILPIGQSTLSAILEEVTQSLESSLCPVWIRNDEVEQTKLWFYERYKIPGGNRHLKELLTY